MNKEEAKQYLRNQINSCILIQSKHYSNTYYLCYNKPYLRALKLSKITGQPVNKDNFNSWVELFGVNTKPKEIYVYAKNYDYLAENYSYDISKRMKIIEEVIKEHEQYNEYMVYLSYK